jgi:hypothetical protein
LPCVNKTFRTIIEKLGSERSKKVIIVGIKEAEQSLHGQLVSGKVIASGLDEELSKEATKAGIYFLSCTLCMCTSGMHIIHFVV